MGQNPYRSIVLAKIWWCHCDVVFDCIVTNFFYKLILILSYLMPKFVKIECQLLLNRGGGAGWWLPPSPAPSFCLILEPRWQVLFEKFLHGQMSQGWAHRQKFSLQKSFSHFWEKLEKPVGGWRPPPTPLAIRGLIICRKRVFFCKLQYWSSYSKHNKRIKV